MKLEDCGDVLSRKQVMEIFQIPSLKALYRRQHDGGFPAPAMTRPMRWFRADLQRWTNGDARPSHLRRKAS